ncbi:extensin family protein [Planktotalea sp.]|uniref:extensin family protein n=1 Tax=Planktotalea sp. TaxID=2029877 RepID=UPI0025E79E0E|nr:extensin family protein [Planktotalea sp.]
MATITLVGSEFLRHPDALVPQRWNVCEPLSVSEPITSITGWKLDWATNDPQLCADIMQSAGRISVITDIVVDENCGIEGRIRLRSAGRATLDPIETSCATALRLAMWEHHGIQPAAREILGSDVKKYATLDRIIAAQSQGLSVRARIIQRLQLISQGLI